MAAYSEITIEQYADFSTTLNIEDIQGNPVNLSGYSVSSQIRKSPYSSTFYAFQTQVSNTITAEITITMNSSVTADLSPGRYLYDLVINSGNEKTRVVEGIATVTAGITRP